MVQAFQIFAVPSTEVVSTVAPSAEKRGRPDNVCVYCTVQAFQIFAVPSTEVVTTVAPSAESAADVCPDTVWCQEDRRT